MIAVKRGTLQDVLDSEVERPDLRATDYLVSAFTNRDLVARVEIASYLLDRGADAAMVSSGDRINSLHVLFSQREHDFGAEAPVLARLFAGGVDVNLRSPRFGIPLKVFLGNTGLREVGIDSFYDVLFSHPGIDWDARAMKYMNDEGEMVPRSLRSYADNRTRQFPEFIRRMHAYLDARA